MSKAVNILCVDTSTEACSVAVLCSTSTGQEINDHFMLAPREHTQKILPMVEGVLSKSGLALADIDVVAFGRGPGSFTGVRVGISIAQGLAYGIEKPMVGISTLQSMAQQAYKTKQVKEVYATIDARMGEVYFGHYRLENDLMVLVNDEIVIKPADLLTLAINVEQGAGLVGSGWAAYPELLDYFNEAVKLDVELPSARFMLDQAVFCAENNELVAPESATPVYLRDKVTWKKLPGRE